MMNPRLIVHGSQVERDVKRYRRVGGSFIVTDDTILGIVQSVEHDKGVVTVYWQNGETRTERLEDVRLLRQ